MSVYQFPVVVSIKDETTTVTVKIKTSKSEFKLLSFDGLKVTPKDVIPLKPGHEFTGSTTPLTMHLHVGQANNVELGSGVCQEN